MVVLDAHITDAGGGRLAHAEEAVELLERAASLLQAAELDELDARAELQVARRLEVARRRIDHGTDRLAGHLDACGAPAADGHRGARPALVHIGRLPSAEAHARVRTARALRRLPAVEAAYARGDIPTAHVRAITRAVANPRVRRHLDHADPIFAEQASQEGHRDFTRWLRAWEQLADADGAARDAASTHERRHVELQENPDGGFSLAGAFGALEGATLREVFDRFVDAEAHADWAEARARLGDAATETDLRRSPRQRRADALVAIFRRAATPGSSGAAPVPLVHILIDQATFEGELAGAAGASIAPDPDGDLRSRRCQTLDGTPLHPSEAVAAALVGHVRRVVLGAGSAVIDLGRRRRLFTGSSREAALLQGALGRRDGLRCGWHGCHRRSGLQVDHVEPAARGGPTDVANSLPLCGAHNRLKEHGWRPVRGPDGRWAVMRPDGSPVTPPV